MKHWPCQGQGGCVRAPVVAAASEPNSSSAWRIKQEKQTKVDSEVGGGISV